MPTSAPIALLRQEEFGLSRSIMIRRRALIGQSWRGSRDHRHQPMAISPNVEDKRSLLILSTKLKVFWHLESILGQRAIGLHK